MSPRLRLVAAQDSGLHGRSDDELMSLAQAGARDAFALLVKRHALRIVNLCTRFVNDAAAGEELAQETWAAAFAERASYRAEGRLLVWLITLARNRCRNYLRRHGVMRRLLQASAPIEATTADQIDRLLRDEERRRLHAALARLPAALREALILRYGEELRYDEMAAVLDVGESTLRSRVHHGLRALRALMEKRR